MCLTGVARGTRLFPSASARVTKQQPHQPIGNQAFQWKYSFTTIVDRRRSRYKLNLAFFAPPHWWPSEIPSGGDHMWRNMDYAIRLVPLRIVLPAWESLDRTIRHEVLAARLGLTVGRLSRNKRDCESTGEGLHEYKRQVRVEMQADFAHEEWRSLKKRMDGPKTLYAFYGDGHVYSSRQNLIPIYRHYCEEIPFEVLEYIEKARPALYCVAVEAFAFFKVQLFACIGTIRNGGGEVILALWQPSKALLYTAEDLKRWATRGSTLRR